MDLIDQHLDAVLRASGSALRHYTMQKTKDDMRAAMQAAMAAAPDAPATGVARMAHLRASKERRLYIAGPMTGIPEHNFPAFNAAAATLRGMGLHVENPAEHGHVEGAEWGDYLRFDISRLATCCTIYLLPGWSKSKGAQLEVRIAKVLGLTISHAVGAEAADLTPGDDPATRFLAAVEAELWRARSLFPGDRIMTIALAEEFGELAKAMLDESGARVWREAVQTAVMAARVAIDGDSSVDEWRTAKGLDNHRNAGAAL